MRKKVLSVLFVTLIISCGKDPSVKPDAVQDPFTSSGLTHIRILGKFNERLEFVGKIGDNFDSALDSLQRKYEPLFCGLVAEGHYSGEGYIISKEKMNVDFSYDDRDFILLTFIDKSNQYNYLITGDVLDGRGNYYRLVERED
jgi:hypothetical protein